jgi:hypothetical protein
MKNRKPLVSWLPGRYGRMTREEFERESNQYDQEFSGTDAEEKTNLRRHPRKRGPNSFEVAS